MLSFGVSFIWEENLLLKITFRVMASIKPLETMTSAESQLSFRSFKI